MSDWEFVVSYEDNKYQLQRRNIDGYGYYEFRVLRYGEPWRNFIGDKFLNHILNDLNTRLEG